MSVKNRISQFQKQLFYFSVVLTFYCACFYAIYVRESKQLKQEFQETMKMYFIGNTCFRRKIVYHNKMHLHYPSLKKRLAPSSIKPRTYVFKKVSIKALIYTYVFLIWTRGFLLQKSRLVFYNTIFVIIYEIIYFILAFYYSHYELNEQAVIVCSLE